MIKTELCLSNIRILAVPIDAPHYYFLYHYMEFLEVEKESRDSSIKIFTKNSLKAGFVEVISNLKITSSRHAIR